jgi:hypothetical protein
MKIVPDEMDTLVWLRSENPADWPQGGQVLTKLRNIFSNEYEDFPTVGHIRRYGEKIICLDGLGRVTYAALIRRLDATHPSQHPVPPDFALALSRIEAIRLELNAVEDVLRSMGRFLGNIKDNTS